MLCPDAVFCHMSGCCVLSRVRMLCSMPDTLLLYNAMLGECSVVMLFLVVAFC